MIFLRRRSSVSLFGITLVPRWTPQLIKIWPVVAPYFSASVTIRSFFKSEGTSYSSVGRPAHRPSLHELVVRSRVARQNAPSGEYAVK